MSVQPRTWSEWIHSWAATPPSEWEASRRRSHTSEICIRFSLISSVSLHKHWNEAPCYYLQRQRKCWWKWPVRSRPSVFHQQLFAVIILQCWCQTRPDSRGEANGPRPPPLAPSLHQPKRWEGREEKNLIHLKCGAAGLGSEMFRESPIKGALCNIRLWMMGLSCSTVAGNMDAGQRGSHTSHTWFGSLTWETTFETQSEIIILIIMKNSPFKMLYKVNCYNDASFIKMQNGHQ